MTDGWLGGDFAREANDCFSTSYDDFNHQYLNVQWTGRLLERAEAAGPMAGRRLLDLGCGTGLSLMPMVDRGWRVVACDVSPAMVDIAKQKTKADDRVEVLVADMRDLPELGKFDLVWAVNDAVNYLLSADELQAALTGMRRRLAPGGVVLFDVNTLDSYRTFFAEELHVEHEGRKMIWTGRVKESQAHPGMLAEARFETEGEPDSVHVHRQRHFPESVVRGALKAAGLRLCAVYGELEGELDDALDEEVHSKAVYICRSDPSDRSEGE
jgi:SAM-dependent methyltransferase